MAARTFQKKIAVTGTAVQLSATSVPMSGGALIQANPDNLSPIVVGGAGVANTVDGTGTGKVLQPGQSWGFDEGDLSQLWVNGAAGDWCDGSYS